MAKVDNLSTIIKNKIKNYDTKLVRSEEGKVLSVSDGIALVAGLDHTVSGELLKFPGNLMGMALNLDEDSIGVILLGSYSHIKEGDLVHRTKKVVEVGVGDELLGRIVDPLGKAQDGKEEIHTKHTRPIERIAPGVMTRQSVNQPLETGILSIDSMIPIGKGQRELIIGDRKTGKTAIAIDTIINQKGKDVYCVYVSIGQKNSTLATTTQKLIDSGAMPYTTIVIANASDSDALQYLAPYTGIAIAEEWMEKGKDVLIIFDDLTKHAVAYRALSLLLRRPPGREAYPGDVFYLHSKLLERAAKLNKDFGGGSITALPIVETQAGDIAAYIPTNIISITDGQIFLMNDMFNAGQRPAVDAGLSVSRVGSSAQTKLMKELSGSLKLIIANYNEVKSFAEFSSDLDEETKKILNKGKKILELLKQPQYAPYHQYEQAFILFSIKFDLIENIPVEKISLFKNELLKQIKTNKTLVDISHHFNKEKKMTPEIQQRLQEELQKTINEFIKLNK